MTFYEWLRDSSAADYRWSEEEMRQLQGAWDMGAATERERCARIVESSCWVTTLRSDLAAAIRAGT